MAWFRRTSAVPKVGVNRSRPSDAETKSGVACAIASAKAAMTAAISCVITRSRSALGVVVAKAGAALMDGCGGLGKGVGRG